MFIPASVPRNAIGKKFHTTREIKVIKGVLTIGSLVIVQGVGERGYDLYHPESGEHFIECGLDCIDIENPYN